MKQQQNKTTWDSFLDFICCFTEDDDAVTAIHIPSPTLRGGSISFNVSEADAQPGAVVNTAAGIGIEDMELTRRHIEARAEELKRVSPRIPSNRAKITRAPTGIVR